MKTFIPLNADEARSLSGGDGTTTPPTTGVTTQSNIFYDLFYMAGYVIGAGIAGFVEYANAAADAPSIVEWKTGVRTAK
ncbi:MAG TPA: hypothetical protein VHD32_11410 [Candidatus Didemnitutus sp.]|nr:hypothetical protein [Candidatus Didemnitutus sp.]